MYRGMQTLPIVYVDNSLYEAVENITITFDGSQAKEPTFRRIKSGERVFTALQHRFAEIRSVYLKYYNKQLAVMEKQEIYKGHHLFLETMGTILVEIVAKTQDGKLQLKITENFS